MNIQTITFQNSSGQRVAGNLIDCGKDFIVVHCHGYGSNKDSETAVALQNALTKNNISSFAFDFSDTGESECSQKDLIVSVGFDELKSAIKYLKNIGFKSFGLSGSSFGGGVVLNYAAMNNNIKAIVLKAPVSDWPNIDTSDSSNLRTKKFINDAKKYTIYNKASKINCPVLIIHGDKDEIVPIEQSKVTCSLIENCQLEIINGSDHRISDHDDKEKLINSSIEFYKKYL